MRRSLFVSFSLVMFFCSQIRPVAAAEPLVNQVRKAIGNGVSFLKGKQEGGHWEKNNSESSAWPGGWTSLALLALLNSGVKPDDPVIQNGLQYLRDRVPQRHTYVVALQTMVYVEAGQKQDSERIQKNVDWLIQTRIRDGDRLLGWSYGERGIVNSPDNSNTQYALLGLHAGKVAGAKIEPAIWKSIRDYYINTQRPDGGWGYSPRIPGMADSIMTMTTAGLCGLLIAGTEFEEGKEKLRGDFSGADGCGQYEENKATVAALGWIGKRFRLEPRPYPAFYNLYGIERAGRLSGRRFFGEHDWYREGCEYLIPKQRDDGSWQLNASPFDRWPVISTSFALLFLSKGRTPVLISKMVHFPQGRDDDNDWNNDRYDARHIVEYASKELFKRQPLAWQVFNPRGVSLDTDAELRSVLGDLLQSPMLYFNGHKSPLRRFTDREKDLLKQYVEQGGFILAEACCGRKEFDQGFRDLMKELFPDNELKPLDPGHPIWTTPALVPPQKPFRLEGINQGCKTVVVYSPQDLSCLWEANQLKEGRGLLAFRLAGNLIAYATGMELPGERGGRVEVFGERPEVKVPRGFLKVGQLKHDGDWHPAPRAMPNLMAYLREKRGMDVALQTEELDAGDWKNLSKFKFMYMHGRKDFTFDPKDVTKIRANLDKGGLLLADACCGKKEFDVGFRRLVQELFTKEKLELVPIPVSDELFSKEINGAAISTVRCRRERSDGPGAAAEFRQVSPALEGVKLRDRWVVIYSKYDLGCALEKHQSPDCLGHDHESALRLASAAVLYALKH